MFDIYLSNSCIEGTGRYLYSILGVTQHKHLEFYITRNDMRLFLVHTEIMLYNIYNIYTYSFMFVILCISK